MNFRYPKRFVLVSAGNRVYEGASGKTAHSSWRSDVELKVAGFNLGDFKRMAIEDETTGMVYEGYATKRPPASLSEMVMSPTPMMKAAVFKSQVATRLFRGWFGPLPYGRLSLTQQPSFGSGQSWPTLIYLPVSAFLDSTQRHSLIGNSEFMSFRFVQEVTPHEVAHQWWGHLVGWATYHDQWISEGFSDFSAGLFLQATGPRDKYIQFLRRSQEVILEKNPFGFRTNDVGPLWMGHRLITAKTASAYRKLIYPKGGFVLHMLQQLMFDAQKASDEPFIRMMHDFVNTHHNKDASTESFKASVEKHMKPWMDLAGTGTMDWFFGQWVYGTELPSYEFEYSLNAMEGGQAHLKGRISQEGVSDGFRMAVPVYVRLKDRLIRIGAGNMIGTDSPLDINMQLPWMPESVEINSLYDVLAEKGTIKRQ